MDMQIMEKDELLRSVMQGRLDFLRSFSAELAKLTYCTRKTNTKSYQTLCFFLVFSELSSPKIYMCVK